MNAIEELNRLTSMFPGENPLIREAVHIPSSTTPEPYKRMLVHDSHMTVTMEQYHGSPVNVTVVDQKDIDDIYCREIILTRADNGKPVQFGIVRFNFEFVTPQVKEEILSGEIPLGRVLINHNVLRHIDLGAIIKVKVGPELARLLEMEDGAETYGRLATIFCNGSPAVDLLEISAPLTPA
ncbi:MAG: hypothetical protein KDA80_14520 [Planctomycetaceae bacterium]|nr:hypothetical protein [Planctomycetaceae bacterium]